MSFDLTTLNTATLTLKRIGLYNLVFGDVSLLPVY